MNSKSRRNRQNQETESRLLDESPVEQRAMQIARDEGRGEPDADDRARAREELLAPHETEKFPEETPELGRQITEWDEVPGSSGRMIEKTELEDENSIGKELVEKGMRGPKRTRDSLDPLTRHDRVD